MSLCPCFPEGIAEHLLGLGGKAEGSCAKMHKSIIFFVQKITFFFFLGSKMHLYVSQIRFPMCRLFFSILNLSPLVCIFTLCHLKHRSLPTSLKTFTISIPLRQKKKKAQFSTWTADHCWKKSIFPSFYFKSIISDPKWMFLISQMILLFFSSKYMVPFSKNFISDILFP